MTKIFTSLFCTLLFLCAFTENISAQTFEWAYAFGGTRSDKGQVVTTDADGNVYTSGIFRDTVDFDPGPGVTNLIATRSSNNRRLDEIFIQKINPAGDLVWAISFGGNQTEGVVSRAMAVDTQGNIIIAGYFVGDSIDIVPGPPVANLSGDGNEGMFVVKFNASGNLLWGTSFAGGIDPYNIELDAAGNIYLCGLFSGTVDFNPTASTNIRTATGTSDIFLCKLDPSGSVDWVTTRGGSGEDRAFWVELDAAGFIYVGGSFSDTVDFSANMSIPEFRISNGRLDAFILKLNPIGGFDEVYTFGGSQNDDILHSLSIDGQGNIIAAGEFRDAVDFDPGLGVTSIASNAGSWDAFVLKLNSSGSYQWVKTIGGSGNEVAYAIETDDQGNIYTGGFFEDTVDFDPGSGTALRTSNGRFDVYIQKLDASGNLVWVNTFGGPQTEAISNYIGLDPNNNIYVFGNFEDAVLFDDNTPNSQRVSRGFTDVYLVKYSHGGTSTNINEAILQNEVLAYPNPTSGRIFLQLNAPTDQINVVVRNTLGQEVIRQTFQSTDRVELDINGANGLYLLELTNEGNRTVIPVVKQSN